MFILQEQPDVFVDACAADHHAQLLFISAFGRDTSVQQFMARLHQSSKDGGVDELTLCRHLGAKPALKLLVGDPRRLDKVTGRMPRAGLLGNLVQVWIFDPALLTVDHAAQAAWIFASQADAEAEEAVAWRLIKELSPVPLLDAWRAAVIDQVIARGGVIRPPCLGAIHAARIELSPDFTQWVSDGVSSGLLPAPGAQAGDRAGHQQRHLLAA